MLQSLPVNTHRPGVSGHWLPVGKSEKLPSHILAEGAFRPAPLREDIRLERRTYRAAAEAQHALGRLDEAAARLPNRHALVRVTQLREAGASLDLDDLFVALPEIMAMDLPDADLETGIDPRVLRLRRADDDAADQVRHGAHLGTTLLSRTARFLANVPLLESDDDADLIDEIPWRTGPAWLGGPREQDAFLLSTPSGPELHAGVAECVTWLDADSDLPLVVQLSLGHYQLAVLQPVAHTGHLSRLLIPLGCIRGGALRDQTLAPSLWFSRANEEYRRQIRAVVDRGDFDSWVTFCAEGIRELCESQIELVYRLEEIRDEQLNTLNQRNDGLARLVDALIGNPVFNTELAVKLSGLSVRQVHTLVKRLEQAHLVRKLDRNRLTRKKNQQVVREVPDVVTAIGMFDRLPYRRDRTVFDK
ncbi:MAG: Fic/DOC family N-terminal domain-containing protein [Actinophytocola sp.]|uniref:Fic family protein n=1 Tax=Actinophytocola sp. TaxID=1872138 RepID=UPI003C73FC5B